MDTEDVYKQQLQTFNIEFEKYENTLKTCIVSKYSADKFNLVRIFLCDHIKFLKKRYKIKYFQDCVKNNVVPNDFQLKCSYDSKKINKILRDASNDILNAVIELENSNCSKLQNSLTEMDAQLEKVLKPEDYEVVVGSKEEIVKTYKEKVNKKNHNNLMDIYFGANNEEFPYLNEKINYSNLSLNKHEELILSRGMNFELIHSSVSRVMEELACAIEEYLLINDKNADEIRREIITILRKEKIVNNISITEAKALQNLMNKDKIIILCRKEDKNNPIVVDSDFYYEEMINIIESFNFELLKKNTILEPIAKKITKLCTQKILPKDFNLISRQHPRLYGLANVKDTLSFSLSVDLSDTLVLNLLRFLIKKMKPEIHSNSYVKTPREFYQKLRKIDLPSIYEIVKLKIKFKSEGSIFIKETLDIMKNLVLKYSKDDENLINICLEYTYFNFRNNHYQIDWDNAINLMVENEQIYGLIDLYLFSVIDFFKSESEVKYCFLNDNEFFLIVNVDSVSTIYNKVKNKYKSVTASIEHDFEVTFMDILVFKKDNNLRVDGICEIDDKDLNETVNTSTCVPMPKKFKQKKALEENKYILLPYIDKVSEKIGQVLSDNGVEFVFVSIHTLKKYLHPLLHDFDKTKLPGVYCIECGNCDYVYNGQSYRPINTRNKQEERDLRKRYYKTALAKHIKDKNNRKHRIQFGSVRVIDTEFTSLVRLNIKEGIEIAKSKYKMNVTKGNNFNERWYSFFDTLP